MNKTELIANVAEKSALSKKDAEKAVNAVVDQMRSTAQEVSTKKQILNTAAEFGLVTVFQIFMIDTQAFGTGVRNAQKVACDAIEIMPGAIPNIVNEVCRLVERPVLCAGLVKTEGEVDALLAAGARGIATSSTSLWTHQANRTPIRTKKADS